MSPDEYASLVGDIIGMAQIRRPSGQYDQADLDGDFSQNLKAIPEVVVFVIDVVLRDFFTGLLAVATGCEKRGLKQRECQAHCPECRLVPLAPDYGESSDIFGAVP
ncbi:phage tail assembly chaperone [Agrobacterium pusense]|uniref:phage tail assembly chaperone n=1 Tax=Agrobacterium pusense TaxID=648995 RepID=UPI003D011C82